MGFQSHILDKDYLREYLSAYLVVYGKRECWCFRNSKGRFERYPYRRINGDMYKVSTLMLWIHGLIPEPKPSEHRGKGGLKSDDILNLHECDNGDIGCVRPDHIFNGTQTVNMQDCMRKGRSIRNTPVSGSWIRDEAITKKQLMDTVARCGGDKYKAAALLGLTPSNLYRKWHRFSLGVKKRSEWRTGRAPYRDTIKHCKKGHLFTPENTYTYPSGKRVCRRCVRDRKLVRIQS